LDIFKKGLVSNAQINSDIEKCQLPGDGTKNLLGKNFNIYKPQVQGISLSTRGVVRRELSFQLLELTKLSRVR